MSVRPWLDGLRSRLQNRHTKNARQRRTQNAQLNVRSQFMRRAETLQDRTLLTSQILLLGNELQILTDADEDIIVQEDPGAPGFVQVLIDSAMADSQPTVQTSLIAQITIISGDSDNTIDVSGVTAAAFPSLQGITIVSGDGDDVITGSDDFADNIDAGDGDDTVNGQGGDSVVGAGGGDTIIAGDGNDSVTGGDGDDSIDAGDGNDVVTGDAGDDTILGDDGVDTLSGNGGNDSIFGGQGVDILMGDAGTDFLQGDLGDDTIVGGTEADTVFGGGGADSVDGNDGADSLFGNSGRDTINGQDGDDIINVGAGSDSVLGGDGDDLVTGGLGDDTIDGEAGNDTLNGGGGDDLVFGDTDSVLNQFFGNDLILGQFGDDTLIGTLGADTIIGGLGDDLIRSSFDTENLAPPPPPVPPVPPPAPPAPGIGPVNAAVSSGGTTALGTSTTLSSGMGDGHTIFSGVDAVGHFDDVNFDPLGMAEGPDPNVLFDTDIFIRVGTTGARTELVASGETLTGVTDTEANSSFTSMGLNFDLVQIAAPLNDSNGVQIGGILTQTYTVTNPGAAQIDFELVRYIENHMFGFGTAGNDGGGIFMSSNGVPIYFESAGAVMAGQPTIFGGIAASGGTPISSNRFEINSFASIIGPIASGAALMDVLVGDTDGDDLIDMPSFDQEVALRNVFSLAAGATDTYTVHTAYGTLVPPPPNMPPVATDDSSMTFGSGTLTIDIISNDSDPDGVPIFSTVNVVTQPVNGTALSLGNGLIEYTPNPGFAGMDSFTYNFMDDDGATSNTATITVTVLAGDEIGDMLDGSRGNDTIIGADGDDTVVGGLDNDSILGGRGDDSLLGGGADDTIDGQEGDDTIRGQGGNDLLMGGDGDDELEWRGAGDGDDTLDGGNGGNVGVVRGDSGANTFAVGQDMDGQLTVTDSGRSVTFLNTAEVNVNGNNGNDTITVGDISDVGLVALTVNGGENDDAIDASAGVLGSQLVMELNGGNGLDTITGSSGAETINGDDGNDSLLGGGGNDTINGGDGDDAMNGDAGDDLVDGGAGNDLVNGGDGNDSLVGGSDQDTLDGQDGDDTLVGGFGDDNLVGNRGDDSLLGGLGADTLVGAAGDDTLDGGRNDDVLLGNSGNDKLRGDHGNDRLVGLNGDDELNGGDGDDTIIGGTGNDGISGGDGDDFLQGDQGNDLIVAGDGNDNLVGGANNDTLLGEQGDDTLNGNGGTDTGNSGEGNNALENSVNNIDLNFELTSVLLDLIDGV